MIATINPHSLTPEDCLIYGAKTRNLALCRFARINGARNFSASLRIAASHDDQDIILWSHYTAEKISVALDYESAISAAFKHNYPRVLTIIEDLARELNVTLNYDNILCAAARYGHREICMLVHDRATSYDRALGCAAFNAQFDTCKLILDWCATRDLAQSLNIALFEAARGDHGELCDRLYDIAGDLAIQIDLVQMARGAIAGFHINLCLKAYAISRKCVPKITIILHAPEFEEMMHLAITNGSKNDCCIVRRWARAACIPLDMEALFKFAIRNSPRHQIANVAHWARNVLYAFNYETAMRIAAEAGNLEGCEYARSKGAHNYEQMREIATAHGYTLLETCAREWIDARNARPEDEIYAREWIDILNARFENP
jgi:hypothetical protein